MTARIHSSTKCGISEKDRSLSLGRAGDGFVRFATLFTLTAGLCSPHTASADGRVAAIKQKLAPLDNFRRIELPVSKGFSAQCRLKRRVVTCRTSKLPDRFPELMVGLRGGTMAGVRLAKAKTGASIILTLKRPEISFQSKVLRFPSRWVLEFGVPLVLMDEVEELVPFRPYPVPPTNISAKLPPPNLHELSPELEENQVLNACYKLWRARRMLEAIDSCNEAIALKSKSPAGEMAKKIVAEIWMGFVDPKSSEKLPKILKALETAESASKRPEDGARYALLKAQTLEAVGYLNRAEMSLANAFDRYKNSRGASYLLAARARMLMRLKESRKARSILQRLRSLRSDAPTVGAALIALAELAYNEGNYVVAIGMFDTVKERWPALLNANSTAIFQAAEVYRLYERIDEAKEAYERFLKLPIKTIPEWMARVRLLEILSFSQPAAAGQKFRQLAISLEKTEGQDLAFIRFAKLTPKVSERRRILANLAAAPTTPYVFEELTMSSIQQALEDGNLADAYRYTVTLWREMPDAYILKAAPALFERTLTLKLLKAIKGKSYLDAMRLYYTHRKNFEGHRRRGELHLLVARSLRAMSMYEEARLVLQKGLGGRTAEREPAATSLIYREMASVLREKGDKYRLGEILDYMDARYPKKFDDFDYWLAKTYQAWWTGKKKRARKILVYALNGPVKHRERLQLMETLVELYLDMKNPKGATKVLKTLIAEHDKAGGARDDLNRRRARWRLCEVWIAEKDWATALAHLLRFLEEYPDDSNRFEARYFTGKAMSKLDFPQKAKRQWNIVSKEDAQGIFGKLARLELEMLAWRLYKLKPLLQETKL